MLKKIITTIFILVALVSLDAKNITSNKQAKKLNQNKNVMGSPSSTHFNINNISTWVYNDGQSDHTPDGKSGFIYPKGSDKTAVFQSGFVWGATINGEKRVGGATYNSGLRPGRIIGEGDTAEREDESLEHVRIYRVRRNYADPNANFSSEIDDDEGTANQVFAQYELDWNNWPAEYGAPYEDVDGDGIYDPTKDIPGIIDADQTIWFVANDLDTATCNSLYGANPIGIEMQATYWGYNQEGALGNVMYRKYKIINKSRDTYDEMYLSMWADPDVGESDDDFIGCDSSLSLIFAYNGIASDGIYGITPPAVGFDFLQGPIVPSPGETAIFDGKLKSNFKNLPMSVHYFSINGDPVNDDPVIGDYVGGTLHFYNLFEGITSSMSHQDPIKFPLSGDPLTGSGWVDGIEHQPGYRRHGMAAGPFSMEMGDTQEVVVAEIVAGALQNVDRLGAVSLLKHYDLIVQNYYNNSAIITSIDDNNIISDYSLSQNYPNPFNPSTKINFSIAKAGIVKLKVYDILGRQVATLINKQLQTGKHTIDFNGNNLASGVYFYRISASDFVDVKKMLLLK